MKKILYRLNSYYQNYASDTEKSALRYILDNPRELISLDIHTLASITYCSASTIVRICKKNGLDGFKSLKLAISNDLNFNDELYRINVENLDGKLSQDVIHNVLIQNSNAIQNTYNLIDETQINKIVKLIEKSEIIRVFGIGASFLVAKDFQQKMERINKVSIVYEDTHMQLLSSNNIKKNEVALIISYSGQTKEIIEMAKNVKNKGGIVISLTKYNFNKLMDMSDYNLFVPNIEGDIRHSAGSSRISQLCIIDILYTILIENIKNEVIDRIVGTSNLLKKDSDIS